MWRKGTPKETVVEKETQATDFQTLFYYINYLAKHKLGYPVSLLTYMGVVDNAELGIRTDSLANILLNNVGDPLKDSETSLMEVKHHEREVIAILEHYYGLGPKETRGYVTTGGTEGNFAALWWSKRYLINNGIEFLIKNDNQIKLQQKEEQELTNFLAKTPINDYDKRLTLMQKIINLKNSINELKNRNQQAIIPTVFFSKEHTHYSIAKIAEILRLNIKAVPANPDGSLDLNAFRKELLLNLQANPHSPVIVIANIGTTVTGAIDDVPGIKKIIEESKPKPIYTIHLDGALTGFVMPILKPFGEVKNYFSEIGVNTLAVSAHKFPGLSQPCGIILALSKFFDKAFTKSDRSIEYVGNILDVTISGSRSGLNVLMFYKALMTLEMDKGTAKLTEMVHNNMANAKYLYDALVAIFGTENVFYPYHFNVIFPKPSTKLSKKYQLMITGERATICVLTNVTKQLIDEFIQDLKADLRERMMHTIRTELQIETLQNRYREMAIELLCNSFCASEPITTHLGVDIQDYRPFAAQLINKAITDGLSKVILDKKNKVIALCLAEDLAHHYEPTKNMFPKLYPIFALLNAVSRPFVENKKILPGKIVHVGIASVDPTYRGQGLSTIVDMAVIEQAAGKGFEFAYAVFTNELSEKVTKQFSVLKCLNRIKYNDFKLENSYPFKGVAGSASAYVAAIGPGVKLENLEQCFNNVAQLRE